MLEEDSSWCVQNISRCVLIHYKYANWREGIGVLLHDLQASHSGKIV